MRHVDVVAAHLYSHVMSKYLVSTTITNPDTGDIRIGQISPALDKQTADAFADRLVEKYQGTQFSVEVTEVP